jgi:hypothetical protein
VNLRIYDVHIRPLFGDYAICTRLAKFCGQSYSRKIWNSPQPKRIWRQLADEIAL